MRSSVIIFKVDSTNYLTQLSYATVEFGSEVFRLLRFKVMRALKTDEQLTTIRNELS